MLRVGDDTVVNWTHGLTRRLFIMPFTFGAERRVDFIDRISHRNRTVRAFGFAHVAIGTLAGNQECHIIYPLDSGYPVLHPNYASEAQIRDQHLQEPE